MNKIFQKISFKLAWKSFKASLQKFALVTVVCSAILVLGNKNIAAQGAVTPFKIYEAENGVLGGGASTLFQFSIPSEPSPEFESSGRSLVKLDATGESVSWTATSDYNAIVVRVCIPDAPSGGGVDATLNLYVDGVFRQAINTTSRYTWVYGTDGGGMSDNNPASGYAKRFFESSRAFITGNSVPAGSTIMLKKDTDNTADYYKIDLVMLENVGPPITQPANTLSVTAYGAIANDGLEDSQAFLNCIAACQSQVKDMWIPVGEFHTKGIINATGISIYGAGMWYTQNTRIIGGRHKWNLTDCNIQDLYIFNPETARELVNGHDYGMTCQGTKGYLIQRVWAQHCGACFWLSGTDATIKDCRAIESWADGINLNNSGSIQTNYAGLRMTAQNNFIIGSGDDGIALNAQNDGGAEYNMVDTKILNNTSIGAMWGNGMRIAGGRNTLLQDNLITDPTSSNGLRVGKFGTKGNPCESALVKSNTILRGCGLRPIYGQGGICVADGANATIAENTINNSPALGVDVQTSNAVFTNNTIINPTTEGFLIKSGATGAGTFTTNVVNGVISNQMAFKNNAPSTFVVTATGNSWQSTSTSVNNDLEIYGNNNIISKNNLNVYPNPSNGLFNLKTNINSEYTITICNSSGKIIVNRKSNNPIEIIDMNQYSAGIYILRITDNSKTYFQKLVKN
ncbi:MAG: T9SS type A sorting domain-containing protein [Tenuifilaceae bacterium]